MRRALQFLLSVLFTLGLVLGVTPAAMADHTGPFVYNATSQGGPFPRVLYVYHPLDILKAETITPGEWSPRGAVWVSVPTPLGTNDDYKVKIQSIVTGAYYTSPCDSGITIGNGDGTGNSAKVVAVIQCGGF